MGSSPLARGLPILFHAPRGQVRIIPARAGFTDGCDMRGASLSDHPRSRGVYACSAHRSFLSLGSSPLARGLLCLSAAAISAIGIIPARAGFTGSGRPSTCRPWDHPRSRGVYPIELPGQMALPGSSPLARGLLHDVLTRAEQLRIIPARAGFTLPSAARCRRSGDHPRSRGVYFLPWPRSMVSMGSSPLARGLPILFHAPRGQVRIIPARAGFTDGCDMRGASLSDHPRSRGVYACSAHRSFLSLGSSPLARGLLCLSAAAISAIGIIPARAGFTGSGRPSTCRPWDHPRSRGVYPIELPGQMALPGSSPLARGLLHDVLTRAEQLRIIPARAGFTLPSAARCRRSGDHPRSRGVYVGPCGYVDNPPLDHPRSRGVYLEAPAATRPSWGSSPLARGLQ